MATIRELAEQLGVSVATVSRVLNNYPDVAPDTREKVLAAIREQDFTPDRAARSLVTGRSYVIGVVLWTGAGHPDLLHPFFQEVLVGLKNSIGGLGYDLLLFSTGAPGNEFGTKRFLSRARHHRVDGMVLMGVDRDDPEIDELVASGIPGMAVDLDIQGGRTGNVVSDNAEGAALAVRHLHERGHRRIALIGGPTDTRPGVDRLLGYRRELQRLGLPHRPEYVHEGDFYPESGYAATLAFLDLPEPPTAIFAAADLMAAGAIRAIVERGLACPRDVAVVGFDDIQMASLLQPSLTTIRQDKQRLGDAAGEALVRLVEDPDLKPPAITIPVELIVRDSTGGPDPADADPGTADPGDAATGKGSGD
ncbi:MAG: LacI family DNA-binding transcriptional regulator [Actinomycetota bacterium]